VLPELEDVNNDELENIDIRKFNNDHIPYFENSQNKQLIKSINNNNNTNIVSNLMKAQENIRGRLIERENLNLNEEENLRKNFEKEKFGELKKNPNKNNEKELLKMPSSYKIEGSNPSNNFDDRKFFVRNSMIPPNFQNLLNAKSKNLESNVSIKKNDVIKRNSLEQKNQVLIEHFRNMLKEASSGM
jgi:hypothetical protein